MEFDPDILITSTDGSEVLLVVETKWQQTEIPRAESQLKAYMRGMGSPTGLLVTPTRLRIYRDRYLTPPEASIELVGEFDVTPMFGSYSGQSGRAAAFRFERDVQSWLESLASTQIVHGLSADLRRAVEFNILPAIWQGVIGAAHPRSAVSA